MTLVDAVKALLQRVPTYYRRKVYAGIGIVASILTIVALVLPHADLLGIEVPDRTAAIVTLALAFLSALAHANTDDA